jgi:hypothetical protein
MRGLKVFIAAALAVSGGVARGQYTFNKIADTSGTYVGFGAPAVNDAGAVAYQASLSAGGQGVFRSLGGSTAPIASGPAFGTPVSINDGGTVAFSVPLAQANGGIYAGSGGAVTTIFQKPEVGGPSNLGDPDINNAGVVAWNMRQPVTGGWGVYTGAGGSITTVFSQAGTVTSLNAPAINNAGAVGFSWADSANNWTVRTDTTTYMGPSQWYTEGAISEPVNSVGAVDINDSGDLAFRGTWFANANHMFVVDNAVVARFESGTPSIPAVNDDGFYAALFDGGGTKSIRVGSSSPMTTVISTGSPLDGSTVTDLAFSPNGFNNNEWLAFTATLQDGRQGVYLATVPEPASAAVLGIVAAAFAARRRRR